jgi:hypothetical protein
LRPTAIEKIEVKSMNTPEVEITNEAAPGDTLHVRPATPADVGTASLAIPTESDAGPGDKSRGELTPQKLRSLGVLWPAEVDRICAEETRAEFLIESFLPAKSIAIVGGDSTIGKSPLICQLALCVAAGIPFLGMKTNQGRVLYFDLENSLLDCKEMRDALVQFLSLSNTPEDFLLAPEAGNDLERLIGEVRPLLVVIDSLRAFRPQATESNPVAGDWLKEIRKLSRRYGCAFVFVHHLRKPGENSFGRDVTEETRVANWLLEMEGPRALVNQTDVRVAVAEGDGSPAALNVKWSRRVHGDSPLVLLERVYEQGEPAGYRPLVGRDFLTPLQQQALDKLPNPPTEFTFKDAKQALGEQDNRTNEFLNKCRQHRLIEKLGRNRYCKLSGGGVAGVPDEALCPQGDDLAQG